MNAPLCRLAFKTESSEVVYKVASSWEEREAAFQLIYKAYLRSGLTEANPFQLRVTPYHLLSTTVMFIAKCRGDVISTISLVGDGALGMPMESIYGPEVDDLRQRGLRLAEVSALADRRASFDRTLPVFMNLSRLMVQYARHHRTDQLLISVHPRHVKFYQRFLKFENLAGLRTYPMVRNRPAVALQLDFERIDKLRPERYDEFFGRPYSAEQLRHQPMSTHERERLRPVAEWAASQSARCEAQIGQQYETLSAA